MTNHRSHRLGGEIQRELSDLIRSDLKDPRIGFVTITNVDVSGDLRHAKVYISIMGNEKEKKDTIIGLEKASGFMRTELSKRIKVRYMPELHFRIDESLDYSEKINSILSKVKEAQSDDEQ